MGGESRIGRTANDKLRKEKIRKAGSKERDTRKARDRAQGQATTKGKGDARAARRAAEKLAEKRDGKPKNQLQLAGDALEKHEKERAKVGDKRTGRGKPADRSARTGDAGRLRRVREAPRLSSAERAERRAIGDVKPFTVPFRHGSDRVIPKLADAAWNAMTDRQRARFFDPKERVGFQGFTDRTGSKSHNDDLSERRARNLAEYYKSKYGTKAEFVTNGVGERWAEQQGKVDGKADRNDRVVHITFEEKETPKRKSTESDGGGEGRARDAADRATKGAKPVEIVKPDPRKEIPRTILDGLKGLRSPEAAAYAILKRTVVMVLDAYSKTHENVERAGHRKALEMSLKVIERKAGDPKSSEVLHGQYFSGASLQVEVEKRFSRQLRVYERPAAQISSSGENFERGMQKAFVQVATAANGLLEGVRYPADRARLLRVFASEGLRNLRGIPKIVERKK